LIQNKTNKLIKDSVRADQPNLKGAREKHQGFRTAANDHNPERDENLHQVEHQ